MYIVEINEKGLIIFDSKKDFQNNLWMKKMLMRDCSVTREWDDEKLKDEYRQTIDMRI